MADTSNAQLLALALQSMNGGGRATTPAQATPNAATSPYGLAALAQLLQSANAGRQPLPNAPFNPNAPTGGPAPQLANPQYSPGAPGVMPQQLPNARYGGRGQ